MHICKNPNYVMEEWNPTPVAAAASPKTDSDSDVDEEYAEDMINDFVSFDTPVKAAEKPPIEAAEKPVEAAEPVKPVRTPLPASHISVCTVKRI